MNKVPPAIRDAGAAPPIAEALAALDPRDDQYAIRFVDLLLAEAIAARASDIHLQPTSSGFAVRWRIDGVLQPVGEFQRGEKTDPATRLKVLARLLTYRTDVPQEGRLAAPEGREMRVSSFPALFGERVVVRIFAADSSLRTLSDLGLPPEVAAALGEDLSATSGAIIICGPAGSGKTTTAYAGLRTLVSQGGSRSMVTLEDPIEAVLPGVSQSQVNPAAGFDLAGGMRSLMRQDPEVILLGEIRDQPTAEAVFQAALSGQLTLSTFHAGNASQAVSRLNDMGIEPYLLRSGLRRVIAQRLLRKLCACRQEATSPSDFLGLALAQAHRAHGCPACRQSGYQGRIVLAELLPPLVGPLGAAVLAREDAPQLDALAQQLGMVSLYHRGLAAVENGLISPAELRRVIGRQTDPST